MVVQFKPMSKYPNTHIKGVERPSSLNRQEPQNMNYGQKLKAAEMYMIVHDCSPECAARVWQVNPADLNKLIDDYDDDARVAAQGY